MKGQWTIIALNLLICSSQITGNDEWRCPNTDRKRTTKIVPYDGKCYQFVNEERYWTHARDYCRDYGGRLVTINGEKTNHFVIDTLKSLPWTNNGVWIGLHDRDQELDWMWSTESEYVDEPMRFEYWASGHPRAFFHSLRDCIRMVRKSHWKWHETPCSSFNWKYRFICEYGMMPTTTQPAVTYSAQFLRKPNKSFYRNMDMELDISKMIKDKPEETKVELMSDRKSNKNQTYSEKSIETASMLQSNSMKDNKSMVSLMLKQKDNEENWKRKVLFGMVGLAVALMVYVTIVAVVHRRRDRAKRTPMEEYSPGIKLENEKLNNTENEYVLEPFKTTVNIYTNPQDDIQVGNILYGREECDLDMNSWEREVEKDYLEPQTSRIRSKEKSMGTLRLTENQKYDPNTIYSSIDDAIYMNETTSERNLEHIYSDITDDNIYESVENIRLPIE